MPAYVNWASETTTTTGTGALTLAPVVPVAPATLSPPRLSTLAVGTQVRYHINVASGAFETGIGTVGAGNTLSRAPSATWDGTTYVSSGATPLALPAGTHTVLCDLAVDDLRFALTNGAVVYIHPNGNDATAVVGDPTRPFATNAAAIAGRGSALVFQCAAGTYAHGASYIVWPVGSTVICDPGCIWTFDGSNNVGTTRHCCVEPAQGTGEVHIWNATINVALSGTITCGPVGWNPPGATQLAYPDFYLHNCTINGQTDVFYTGGTTSGRLIAIDCKTTTKWDTVYINSAAGGVQNILINCDMVFAPRRDATGLTGNTWGQVLGAENTLILSGGSLTYDTASGNTATGASNWRGLNLADGGQYANKLVLTGGFRRIDLTEADAFVPFYIGGANGSPSRRGVKVVGGVGVDFGNFQIADGSSAEPPLIIPVGSSLKLSYRMYAGTVVSRNTGWKFSAAALTQTFKLITLPPGCMVEKLWVEKRISCAGPTTMTIEIGTAAATTKYLAATDVKTAGIVTPVTPNVVESYGDQNVTDGTIIVATFRSTGTNLSAVTAGDIIVHMMISPLEYGSGVPQ